MSVNVKWEAHPNTLASHYKIRSATCRWPTCFKKRDASSRSTPWSAALCLLGTGEAFQDAQLAQAYPSLMSPSAFSPLLLCQSRQRRNCQCTWGQSRGQTETDYPAVVSLVPKFFPWSLQWLHLIPPVLCSFGIFRSPFCWMSFTQAFHRILSGTIVSAMNT